METMKQDGQNSLLMIPNVLIIEILSRLPPKAIGRCRCVSKLCASILDRQDFTELFLTRCSVYQPKLLFVCNTKRELFLFSSPQPQNPDENSNAVIATYHVSFPHDLSSFQICFPCLVHGLVGFPRRMVTNGTKNSVLEICNPCTGQFLTLPKVKTERADGRLFFGYDPVKKQYKVLSMTYVIGTSYLVFEEHQVLTFGKGQQQQPSWRMIKCSIPHFTTDFGICINGVLYYKASVDESSYDSSIVCFDLSSENFNLIHREIRNETLINYNGKLASLTSGGLDYVHPRSTSIELWVLEDLEKQEWSKHVFELPDLWNDAYIAGDERLDFVGVTQTNEIVLSHNVLFSVFYYNIERKTISRLEIRGMREFKRHEVDIYLDHVAVARPMQTL